MCPKTEQQKTVTSQEWTHQFCSLKSIKSAESKYWQQKFKKKKKGRLNTYCGSIHNQDRETILVIQEVLFKHLASCDAYM